MHARPESFDVAAQGAGPTMSRNSAMAKEVGMARGILVFLAILLLGGGVFWALVGGCVR